MSEETIAAFDFDGTITRKDTLLEFIKFSKGRFMLYSTLLLFSPLLVAMKLKLLPNWKVKQLVFAYLYKGLQIEIFDKWGFEFCAVIDKMLCPKAVEALNSHKKNSDKIVIVSASIENWIRPWADKAGISMVLATKIETDEKGLITGRFLTKNCYGQEKVNRLLEAFPDMSNYRLVAYGDSRGDREMIEFADDRRTGKM
jgi:HAD superfamily hydrolase (TIGR01490 family)